MLKSLFAIAVGIAIGYQLGWSDHDHNQQHILRRLSGRATDAARDLVKSKELDSLTTSVDRTDGGGRPASGTSRP